MKWSDGGAGTVNAVTTTGIYCRAGCAGRPRPEHTRRLRSPAEAEAAGYRACLRCRPDRLPLVSVSDETDPLVAHALVLVGEGALDRGDEHALAAEVGVSARHLRRLFAVAVGATPTQVAASRRAHFARMLLDESRLTVTEIAFASGFGSVRSMNDSVRSTFRATPSELRARSRRNSVDGGLTLRLRAHRPVDWERMLCSLSTTAIAGVECVEDGSYRRSTRVCGHSGVVELTMPDPHTVRVVAHLPALTGLIDEVGRCRRLLGLDRVDARPGAAGWSSFERDVRSAVLTSRAEHGGAILAALAGRFGNEVTGAEALSINREFPDARRLRRVRPADVGHDRTLCERLIDLAECELGRVG